MRTEALRALDSRAYKSGAERHPTRPASPLASRLPCSPSVPASPVPTVDLPPDMCQDGGMTNQAENDQPVTRLKVDLVGEDGNAFSILGRVTKAMRRAGISPAVIDQYRAEAMSGDYDHLLQTTMRYVEVS